MTKQIINMREKFKTTNFKEVKKLIDSVIKELDDFKVGYGEIPSIFIDDVAIYRDTKTNKLIYSIGELKIGSKTIIFQKASH